MFRNSQRTILIVQLLVAFLFLPSCKKETNSSLSVTPDYLKVSGVALDNQGMPLSGVQIFSSLEATPLAMSDDTGRFSFAISDTKLNQQSSLKKQTLADRAPENFRLFLDLNNGQRLMGITQLLNYSDRGNKDLGNIVLQTPSSISGIAKVLPESGEYEPASGFTVYFGRSSAKTAADGSFVIENVPAGDQKIFLAGEGYSIGAADISLLAGENKQLEYPIIVFPSNIVAGWISPKSPKSLETLISSGHPFQRSFSVSYSPLVKYIKYHHDRTKIEDDSSAAPWEPVKNTINYDFPTNGGHNLYVQFSDEGNSTKSSILTISATVDAFSDTTGIVIGDGSGIANQRTLIINADLPAAATKMRCAISEEILNRSAFMPAKETFEYILPLSRDPASGLQTVFCQFSDNQNNQSMVYKASVMLEIFPHPEAPVFTIEGGAQSTIYKTVTLQINVPQNAYQMQVIEGRGGSMGGMSGMSGMNGMYGTYGDAGVTVMNFYGDDEESAQEAMEEAAAMNNNYGNNGMQMGGNSMMSAQWVPASNTFVYKFDRIGLKQLSVQFRDIDGAVSSYYMQTIRVLPFSDDSMGVGFGLNFMEPIELENSVFITPSREIILNLYPPVNAIGYKISENINSLRGLPTIYLEHSTSSQIDPMTGFPYVQFMTDIPYILSGSGYSTIYIQYVNLDQDTSSVYERTIAYSPLFGEEVGIESITFDIDQSHNWVTVSVFQPIDVVSVALFEGNKDCSTATFEEIKTDMNFEVSSRTELTEISLIYKLIDGTCSLTYRSDLFKIDTRSIDTGSDEP